MKIISRTEFVKMMEMGVVNGIEINGATFVGIDTMTKVPLTGGKKNPHQGKVKKLHHKAQVMIFQNKRSNGYENMVRRRLEAEGKNPESFELSPRVWGERLPNCPIVVHSTKNCKERKYYFEVIFLKAGESAYYLNGNPVDKREIIGLEEKEEGMQGGLENKVIIRTYNVDNIIALRVNNEEYIVVDDVEKDAFIAEKLNKAEAEAKKPKRQLKAIEVKPEKKEN